MKKSTLFMGVNFLKNPYLSKSRFMRCFPNFKISSKFQPKIRISSKETKENWQKKRKIQKSMTMNIEQEKIANF